MAYDMIQFETRGHAIPQTQNGPTRKNRMGPQLLKFPCLDVPWSF